LGCNNKIPQAEWLINTRNLFPTVVEAGSPRLKCQCGWWRLSYCILKRLQKEQGSCLISVTVALISFMKAPPS